VLDFDPNFGQTHFDLGMTYLEMKKFEEAIHEFETALELSGTRATIVARIGIAYAEWGYDAKAREVLAELERLSERRYVSPYDFAELHLALGEMDATFDKLDEAFRARDSFMIYLGVDPAMRRARSDPRFAQLAERMHIPAWVRANHSSP
jgi:tetratricopeptide (TPR) repeat protein